MRPNVILCMLVLASAALAKEPRPYQRGTLLQMDSVSCGVDEKDSGSVAGEMIGTDSSHKKTHELLCQEYVLQTDHVVYRIRPKDDKHPVLLPVGDQAQFRLEKDKIMLRVEDLDNKEREYTVISMTPRGEGSGATISPIHLNHLQ
ncbi:MAG TPA: hypothetical protein VMU61_01200 [Candidatus Aquilonibacter sp.]|nr:hypothetical protein [Candidatus Aquilonibacter sp.]